jgi:molybdate transport system substrate-binding protein
MIRVLGKGVALLTLLGMLNLKAAELNVYAAASLSDALTEVSKLYQKQSGDKILFNFAASSVLERQITEGAPADLFFSADEAKMDDLEKKQLLENGSRKALLSNTLVIVVAIDSNADITMAKDLLNLNRIAIAEPDTVPAGIYARGYLEAQGLWPKLKDRVLPTENVRGTLSAVESGNVEAGIVYRTDAAISKRARVAFEIPAAEGPKISYPLAIMRESKKKDAAKAFTMFLQSPDAAAIFRKYKFIVLK